MEMLVLLEQIRTQMLVHNVQVQTMILLLLLLILLISFFSQFRCVCVLVFFRFSLISLTPVAILIAIRISKKELCEAASASFSLDGSLSLPPPLYFPSGIFICTDFFCMLDLRYCCCCWCDCCNFL